MGLFRVLGKVTGENDRTEDIDLLVPARRISRFPPTSRVGSDCERFGTRSS